MGLDNAVHLYVVTYDIVSDRRRTKVFEFLKEWGDHRQYSVFTCRLGPQALVIVRAELTALINKECDQILLFDLGPATGGGLDRITSIGMPYLTESPAAIII